MGAFASVAFIQEPPTTLSLPLPTTIWSLPGPPKTVLLVWSVSVAWIAPPPVKPRLLK